MNEPKEKITSSRIINRHKARMLSDLEDAGCPVIFKNAVVSGLNWLRSDIDEYERKGKKYETTDTAGNR